MKKTILFIFIVICAGLTAQTTFQKTTGTIANDRNYNMTALENGDIIATGYTESVAANMKDAFLIKYNSLGKVIWAKTYGGPADETIWDVESTTNNEILAAGNSGSVSTHTAGVLARCDTAGNVIYLYRVFSNSGAVNLYSVMETSTGDIIAAGLFHSNGKDDMLICKFNASGNLIWSRVVSTAQNDEIMGMTETMNGNYVFAGLTNDNTGSGGSDFAAVKTDTAGNIIWKKRYGGVSGDRLNDVVAVNDAYYFSGWSNSTGAGSNDAVVMKTDTAGNILWINTYGTAESDRAFSMLYDDLMQSLIIAGYTDYSSPTESNRNTLLMSVDQTGNINRAGSYGGSQTDGHWPTGLCMNNDKGYYVLGSSETFGPGNMSIYLSKTDTSGFLPCNLKDPQLQKNAVTGWSGVSFGTDSAVMLLSDTIMLYGQNWAISSSTQCCSLYADAGPDMSICPADTVMTGTPAIPGYVYDWKINGNSVSANSQLEVTHDLAGTYILTASAPGSDCAQATDTVVITALPAPSKPVITTIAPNHLMVNSTDSIQWYLDNNPVSGANDQVFIVQQSGHYHVVVTNQYGCGTSSDTLYYNTGLDEKAASGISVSPNPVNNLINVSFGQAISGQVLISLYDHTGRKMLEEKFNHIQKEQTIEIPVRHLKTGQYFLRILSGEKNISLKILIE